MTLLCAFLRRFCPLAYSCRRVAARAARLSINRSLGELFANDSDEKRVSRGTEGRDGGEGRGDERKKNGSEWREPQMFALVPTFVSGQRSTLC